MPRGGGRGSRGKGGPPSKRGAYSGPAGGAPRIHGIPDGLPVDLSRHKDVEWVEINGSVLEGGGQILRNATAYSCLLCKPIHITKIRAGRSNPGLRPQHLTGIRLIAQLCGGALMGDRVGSQEVCFIPGALRGGEFVGDTHTAGSICLMLQAALPCLLFAPETSRLVLRGGTNADMAPPIDYVVQVLQPVIAKLGAKFDCQIVRRGFYPKGGGEVVVTVNPTSHLEPVGLVERGSLTQVTLQAFATPDIPAHVVPRVMSAATGLLQLVVGDAPVVREEIMLRKHEAVGNGCGVNCAATTDTGCTFGGNGIGKPGLPAQDLGRQAAEMLNLALTNGGCVDDNLQDQLIIFMALARGMSQMCCAPLTLHTKTAIYVAELMTGVKFKDEKIPGSDTVLLSCEGIGLKNIVHA